MAKNYRLTPLRRLANLLMRWLLRLGLAPRVTYLLTTRGRRSGRLRSTPVNMVALGGERWLVAPYGVVGWVRNAREAGQVTLSRGRSSERVQVVELGAEEAAPVLRRYVEQVPITRPYFDAGPEDPQDAFILEARNHPVFRIAAHITG